MVTCLYTSEMLDGTINNTQLIINQSIMKQNRLPKKLPDLENVSSVQWKSFVQALRKQQQGRISSWRNQKSWYLIAKTFWGFTLEFGVFLCQNSTKLVIIYNSWNHKFVTAKTIWTFGNPDQHFWCRALTTNFFHTKKRNVFWIWWSVIWKGWKPWMMQVSNLAS